MQLKSTIMAVLVSLLIGGQAIASEVSGARFLLDKVSARSAAISAGVGESGGADVLCWNPAGIYEQEQMMLELTHYAALAQDNNIEQLSLVYPKLLKGNVGAKFYYERLDNLTKIYQGKVLSEGEYTNMYLDVVYSYKIKEMLGIGVGIKWISSKLLDYEAQGIAVDIGASAKLWKMINVGLVVENLGNLSAYYQEEDELPLQISLGISGEKSISKLNKIKILIDASQEIVGEQAMHIRVGGEYEILKIFKLRLGYRIEAEERDNLSIGLGVKYQGIGLDYAYQPHEELGVMHRISASYNDCLFN